jgi:hypothetical protein
MADDEIEIVVTSVDRTNPGVIRAKWRRLGKDLEDDSREAGDKSSKGFMSRFAQGFNSSDSKSMASGLIGKFQGFMTSMLKPTAFALATGFSAQFVAAVASGLASGAVKMVKGLGAIGALLPSVIASAAIAVGALRLALAGVGDALKAGLAGDTAKFNEALKEMHPAAQSVLKDVAGLKPQFDGLRKAVQGQFFAPLVGQVKPLAERYLPMIERTLRGISGQFGQVGSDISRFLLLPAVSDRVAVAMDNVRQAVRNVVAGLGHLAVAFLPLITVGSSFLPGLTAGFDTLTARVAAFMLEAERTGRLREFISDGLSSIGELIETAKQLGRIFGNLAAIGKQAFDKLSLSGGGLLDKLETLTEKAEAFFKTPEGGRLLNQILGAAKGVAESFLGTLQKLAEMIAPFLPSIARFVEAFNNLKTAILDAIKPALPVLAKLMDMLTDLMNWMSKNPAVIQGILIGLFTAWAIHAGIAAAATIAATWPLILIGIAVAALAALVIIHFDTIKRVISAVWNWVKDNWPLLLGILTGPFGAVVGFIVGKWDFIIGFLKGLPGRIAGAVKGLFESIYREAKGVFDRVASLLNALPGPDLVGRVSGGSVGIAVAKAGAAYRPPARPSGARVRVHAHGGIGGGLMRVAERGRELLQLPSGQGVLVGAPQGTRVQPNGATEAMLAGGGGGMAPVVNITVNVAGSIRSDREIVGLIRDEYNRGGIGGFG